MPLKFCANLSFMFQECSSLIGRYNLAKEAGFKGVECAFPYNFELEKVFDAKKEAGVQQVLINAYPGNWSEGDRGLAAIPGRKSEFEESIAKSVEYALKLDCKRYDNHAWVGVSCRNADKIAFMIHIMSGVTFKETHENSILYEENLRFAANVLEQNDIIGLIEPINKHSLPNYFLNSFQKAVSVIQKIDSPYIRLQLDLFHLQHICGEVFKNIEELLPLVGHMQIAQVPSRNEPNTPGEIDFGRVFPLLERLGYDGWIGLEYTPAKGTIEGLSWLNEMGYPL